MLTLELKGLIDVIIERFMDIMNIAPFKPQVDNFIRTEYIKSVGKMETELNPIINFVPDEKQINFLNDYVFQNLQGHANDVGNNLRQELQRGILNKETPQQLKQRVKEVFADSKYSQRLKTVMRTEQLRANNAGAFSGAQQAQDAGIVLKKFLDITMDNRTSDICKAEMRKYGKKENAIPLNQNFEVKVANKTYRALHPPFHPNCFLPGTQILTDKGKKNIEDIQIGDNVLTHKNRFKEVYSIMDREIDEEIYEIETSQGVLEVTGEHPVMTNKGWKLVKELTEEDWILYLK